jgi:hypothetical protein
MMRAYYSLQKNESLTTKVGGLVGVESDLDVASDGSDSDSDSGGNSNSAADWAK